MNYAYNNEVTVSFKKSDYRNTRMVLEDLNYGFQNVDILIRNNTYCPLYKI